MKRCPACGRTFTNNTLVNCLNDGAVLVEDVSAPPPYLGASAAEASSAETPPSFAETPDTPAAVTYTDTPLSAIPELQSPQMQAAIKDALDKAGLSGLLDANLAHSTISVTTRTTTSQGGTPFFTAGTPLPALTAEPVRRKRLPWGGLVLLFLLLFAAAAGLWYINNKIEAGFRQPAPVKSSSG